MSRTRLIVIALIVCAWAVADAHAQLPAPEGWVVLPVDEYRALRARANPDAPATPAPPVDATLTRVDYELAPDGDAIAGRALLTVDVLREGWVKVPIPTGLMVRDARLDGQPVPLIEGPPAHVMLSRAGRSVLSLELVIPLTASAGTEAIALPASPAPISRATLALPRTGVELVVSGGYVIERAESASESRWTAIGRPNQPLAFSWKRKVDDRRAEQALRFRARVTSLVGLGEEVSSLNATIHAEVLQGLTREITVAVPQGMVINQVNGATVADWEVVNGLLRVRMLDPITTAVSFVIQGEGRLPADGEVRIPLVRVPAAERETGGVAISVLGAGEIEKHQMRGLEPADVADLADVIAGRESPSMVAFRLRPVAGNDARSLAVSVKRYTPQAVLVANIEEARYRVMASEDGLYLVEGHFAVRNNQRSFLKVTLPPDSTIWSASVAGKPVRPGVAEGDAVLLALEKGRAGEDAPTFVVRITYLQQAAPWSNKARARLTLAALDLPISRIGIELHHSPRFRPLVEPGPFRIEADPGVFAEALRGRVSVSGFGLSSGSGGAVVPGASAAMAAAPPPGADESRRDSQLRQLIDRYRNEGGGRTVAGTLPVNVAFPTLGSSVFMAAELTAESAAPSIAFTIRRSK
jgi:hypothetical protein